GQSVRVESLRIRKVRRHGAVAGNECIERRCVAWIEGPLRFTATLREVNITPALIGERRAHGAHDIRVVRRSAMTRPIDYKGGIARLDESLGPAGPAIGRFAPFGALQRPSMYEDYRQTLSHLSRCL